MTKSILPTDEPDVCYGCGIGNIRTDVHHIYGGSNRKVSDENGFIVHLCRLCHRYVHENNITFLKTECQKEYEKTHSREEFMKLIGKNYLED